MVNVLLKAENYELDLSISDLEKLARVGVNLEDAFEAFKLAKRDDIDITKDELLELQNAGGDMFTYVKAYSISKQLKFDIAKDKLESDVVEGRDVLKVIFSMNYAKKEGVNLTYNKGIRLDKTGEHDIAEVVQWAVNPQIIDIEPITIISQDAIAIKLSINITVRGKIDQYLRGSREKVINDRVNEAAIKEVERFKSYQEILESLNNISERLFKRLTGIIDKNDFPELNNEEIKSSNKKEIKLNSGSAFEILDINIHNVEMGKDAYSDIRKAKAELDKIVAKTESEKRKATAIAKEYEAKTKLIEAEAELNKGMAEAFKEGKLSTKEYYKKKIYDNDHHKTNVGGGHH